jgi:hypothetical protein
MTQVGNIIINDHQSFDAIAPGIIDLQVAYAFSTEIHGGPVNYSLNQAWAFTLGGGNGLINDGANDVIEWFEVRQVRFTIHARRMRAIDNVAGALPIPVDRAEDGGIFAAVPRALAPELLTSAETLVNLRFFDFGLPSGVPAEPY